MRPARDSACVTASDSAEAQTETKLHNVTNAHREANRRELCVCVLTCVRTGGGGEKLEEQTEKARERAKERERKRESEWKKRRGNRTAAERRDIHHAANQFRERRACV